MKTQTVATWINTACCFLIALSAQAQIHVDEARIGCLDIQKDGNLTAMVGNACNNRTYCSFKAPTPDEYKRAGVQAKTRIGCTQGMEVTYHCRNTQISVPVHGDAWNQSPAELTCDALQPLPQPQPPGARLKGFVDLHAHPLSNLGFGGKLVYGGVDIGAVLPADPDCNQNVLAGSLDQALGHDKSTHGGHDFSGNPCGDEIRKLLITEAFGHAHEDEIGAPSFTDWPFWDDVTHQKMWVDWIRRAYNAGLRVMVALAVNNKTLGDAVAGSGGAGDYPTDDKWSADFQIAQTIAFVGRHPDFMEIAYTPADLERIVRANKLAVVLGVEIDNIGNLKGTPSYAQITQEIDHLYNAGVRYIFPIHLLDNAFGGTAAYQDEFNFSTFREEGHYWDLGCPTPPPRLNPPQPAAETIDYKFQLRDVSFQLPITHSQEHVDLTKLLNLATPKLHTHFTPLPNYPNCGQTNNLGLTSQGEAAIRWMMHHGILIDVDHMSDNSRNKTIAIAGSISRDAVIGYPLNSGHGGLRGYFPAGKQRDPNGNNVNERSTTLWQYQQIKNLHGMAGIGSAGTPAYQWADMYRAVLNAMGNSAGSSTGAIAGFGTDLNGLEKGMPPPSGCIGGTPPSPQYNACVRKLAHDPDCHRQVSEPPAKLPKGTSGPSAGGTSPAAECLAKAEATCFKQFPFKLPQPRVSYSSTLPMSTLGSRSFDYNALGVAHYGMLADFLEDVRTAPGIPSGKDLVENNLMYGADYFLATWKKCEALKDAALPRNMTATAVPELVRPGAATTVVVHVTDSETHTPVPKAVVHVGSQVFPAGQPFQHVFTCHAQQSNPGIRSMGTKPVIEVPDVPNPTFAVTALGYADSTVEFSVAGAQTKGMKCQ